MTPNEYQQLALRTEQTLPFANVRTEKDGMLPSSWLSRLLHGAIGICTETGELQDALKKHVVYNKPLDLVNVQEEAGDIAWYLALLCDAAGYQLEDVMERNIAKLRARYPDKFSEEAALTRDLVAERAELEKQGTRERIQDLEARVADAMNEAESWKKRALAHGCKEDGDPDCG